jgi:hypothetical protein
MDQKCFILLLACAATLAIVPVEASAGNNDFKRPTTVMTVAVKPGLARNVSSSPPLAGEKRRVLQSKVKQEEANIKKLQAEMKETNDQSGFNKFTNGLFGSDSGAGDVSRSMARNSATQKKPSRRHVITEPCKISLGC